ncbi:hypothetical protein A7D02_21700 (plasmid) [Aeromonas salmonicida]|nr:hypothetical protein AXW79_01065 [Aeromonas salmonicida subsp. salmonicida]ORJ13869.1 hypothetical protein A7D02_21700 [Aeromonas salmonicida]
MESLRIDSLKETLFPKVAKFITIIHVGFYLGIIFGSFYLCRSIPFHKIIGFTEFNCVEEIRGVARYKNLSTSSSICSKLLCQFC